MKIALFVFITAGFLNVSDLSAQCPQRYNYSYLYDTGDPVFPKTYCTRDPAAHPQRKKAVMPLKLCYLEAFFTGKDSKMCSGENLYATFKSAVQNVVNALNDVCAPDNSLLKINASEECEEGSVIIIAEGGAVDPFFGEADEGCYKNAGAAITTFPNAPLPGFGSGQLSLNFTDQFKKGNSKYPPRCWSGNCNGRLTLPDGKTQCMDLESILMHELGHILGLSHIGGVEYNSGFDTFGHLCNTDQSMLPDNIKRETMYLPYGESNFDQRSNISCYMGCALKQLYCPERANVPIAGCIIDGIEILVTTPYSPSLELYPQPSAQTVTLLIRTNVKYLTLEVYSGTGSIVERRRIEMNGLSQTITLPVHEYPSGVYYAVVYSKDGLTSARFVVTH